MRQTLPIFAIQAGDLWLYRPGPRGVSHRHDGIECNVIRRGHVTYLIQDRRYELRRHDLLWLHPDEEHLLIQASPDTEMWIGVLQPNCLTRLCSPELLAAFSSPTATRGNRCRLDAATTRRLDRFAGELMELKTHTTIGDRDAFIAGLAFLFSDLWRATTTTDVASNEPDVRPVVDQAARLIAQGDDRSVEALAAVLGIHPDSLSRQFHRDLGLTLVDYRNRCRLDRFLEHAVHQRATVLDAALSAGFGSYQQFHRIFRQHFDCSPRDYLKHRLADD